MMKVFVDEAFQFTLCMLDFRILGFYVRPPEPQSPWSALAATDAPHPKCVIWQASRWRRFYWRRCPARYVIGLSSLDESRKVKRGQRGMGHSGNPIVSMESITNAPSSTRYRAPTVTCGRVQNVQYKSFRRDYPLSKSPEECHDRLPYHKKKPHDSSGRAMRVAGFE